MKNHRISAYLPSKNFITVLATVLVVVTVVFVASKAKNIFGAFDIFGKGKDEKRQDLVVENGLNSLGGVNGETKVNSAMIAEAVALDTDKDGLKDWEEVLWKTDPNKADTDGDGYSDKEEVDGGYNPLDKISNLKTGKKADLDKSLSGGNVAGTGAGIGIGAGAGINAGVSNGASADEVFGSNGLGLGSFGTINFTQAMAQSMGTKMMSVKEGGALSPEILFATDAMDKKTADALTAYTDSFNVTISDSDIKISTDNSSTTVAGYVRDIFTKPPAKLRPMLAVGQIFEDAVKNKDYTIIDEYVLHYEKTAEVLKGIVTPSEFKELHKQQISMQLGMKRSFEAIKESEKDIIKATVGIDQYDKIQTKLDEWLKSFSTAVTNHGVRIL